MNHGNTPWQPLDLLDFQQFVAINTQLHSYIFNKCLGHVFLCSLLSWGIQRGRKALWKPAVSLESSVQAERDL